jgi:hypothetical protein
MWANLVVVLAPSLHLFGRVRKGEEPMGVQTFGPEAPIEGLDIGIGRGLSGSGAE